MKKLYLASKSPRRKYILTNAGIDFNIISSEYEEELESLDFSYKKIENLAKNKAFGAIENATRNSLILGADTVVVLENQILTKPQDEEDAKNMLKLLSDKEHLVVTSVCLLDVETKEYQIDSTTTKVVFNNLSNEMIDFYVTKYKPLDKAGAYGIQEMPDGYIKQVIGDIENVIGLSSKSVLKLLSKVEIIH